MTPLSYALLGLVHQEPRSGYALRKVFETTPLGNYSSSPGSIYPALKNLEKSGLIVSRPQGTRKAVFVMTPAGRQAFETWLAQPVTRDDVARSMDALMMRFALLHDHPDHGLTRCFLTAFAAACREEMAGLDAFMSGEMWAQMPLQSRLAVQFGRATTETAADWADGALRQLETEWGG